ncbi:histidine protein methyltransferase 1 homolog [Leguminivora glycinivorella]|uniref:histidine protein methyltransferase 1 homolog n=1 Tax=Leguminivora glycinivorella TaxID=1035111 RepID=UPI00200D3255|nr:histidine protein methyltransferase 1 homolog [Leguminivora glycinivorella]
MSTFKFNFSNDGDAPADNIDKANEQIVWLECEEVTPNKQIEDIEELLAHARMFACGDVEIGHVVATEALNKMYTGDSEFKNAVELAEKEHKDLVAGKYEGGLKIWECTYDLIEYLENLTGIQFENKKILDLGCGAGILGIYTFLKDASVTFQDYNKEILECVTIPNVLLNIEENENTLDIKKCKFYSGDWASFNNKLEDTEVFDIILTSETIYNTTNYDKLIDLFVKRLSKDGEVYIAAKTCYFGVGGGMRQFEATVEKNGLLESKVCWKSSGGILREILKLTKKM